MNKYRLLVISLVILTFAGMSVERIYLQDATALQRVIAVTVKDAGMRELPLETLEVVNDKSVDAFAKDALVQLFNFRPGRIAEHMDQDALKKLFINKKAYAKFKEQMLQWADYEFKVNNISIKETVANDGMLISSVANQSEGMRLWRYRATVLTLDRGVGKSIPTKMFVELKMVYLGPQGGMGIYSVKITLQP